MEEGAVSATSRSDGTRNLLYISCQSDNSHAEKREAGGFWDDRVIAGNGPVQSGRLICEGKVAPPVFAYTIPVDVEAAN